MNGRGEIILCRFFLKVGVRVYPSGIFLEIIDHRVPDRIGKSGLFSHQNVLRTDRSPIKRVAEQIFSLAVAVHLHFRVNAHDILTQNQGRRTARALQESLTKCTCRHGERRTYKARGCAFRLPSGMLRHRRREIRVFVAEKLIGNLPCQKNSYVCVLVDVLADKIHSHASRGSSLYRMYRGAR